LLQKKQILPPKPQFDSYWIKLVGHPSEFPLNTRIFHASCVISVAALKETLDFEQSVAARKGIRLDYFFDPYLMIYADQDMMQLIVRNFCKKVKSEM
jgi:hypothetical protein